ncbi:MAG: CRTAC1 family protein [Bryobacteraceae bacterium]
MLRASCVILSLLFLTVAALPAQSVRFREVAKNAGLNFILNHHPTPEKHMIETMPGGVAAFDYDNDGLPDIFFTNGAAIPSMKKDSPRFANRLFRNEGNWKFRDVTTEAGLSGEGYSMGVAAGDFDNDGHIDIFVAGVHRNILYRNLGNGRFEDITTQSGIKSDEWSVAAGWFDFDNDGLLDLFVVNYGKWSPAFDRFCGDAARSLRIYCHPRYFEPRPNQIYRNLGSGRFEDVTRKSGIGAHAGRGMSVAFADFDRDGLLDAFVTNDNMPNFLFRNLGSGRFEETALLAGAALLDHGKPVASMGVDFRDYDNDGFPDLSVTALSGETFPLFRHDGKGGFTDATFASRMASVTSRLAGWGNGFFDFNNDGWKDLFTANGHVNDLVEKFEPYPYLQPNAVFVNRNGKFEDSGCPALAEALKAHRGAAFADFDNDGKIDVVVTALGAPAELWRNVTETDNHWISLRLIGSRSNRDGIGAEVSLSGQTNLMTTAVSYASSSHDGVHFGLGSLETVPRIEVRWPSGRRQVLENVKVNQVLTVREPE